MNEVELSFKRSCVQRSWAFHILLEPFNKPATCLHRVSLYALTYERMGLAV
jgi:hypothetical protein